MAGAEGKIRAVDSGAVSAALAPRMSVQCVCGHRLFDGTVVRARVVRLLPRGGGEALCRCKRWQTVPVSYDASRLAAVAGPSTNAGCAATLAGKV